MSTGTTPAPLEAGTVSLSASLLARALGLPEPTAEQRDVIEAAPGPAIVVAGAGSGKTETMAGRVVWLVANGHVRPDEVLGLTFTRKAAGELAERIERRLSVVSEFARRGLLSHLPAMLDDGALDTFWAAHRSVGDRARRTALASLLDDAARRLTGRVPDGSAFADETLLRPRVTTYNAFADGIVREHGVHVGRDPDAALLSQSASWLLARRVVIASEHPDLPARGEAFSTIVDAVHRLAGEVLDNRVDLVRLADLGRRWSDRLERMQPALVKDRTLVEKAGAALGALPMLSALVADYAARKDVEQTLDFADQVSGALQIVERAPHVASELRSQYRAVLLDEYQDTSVIQTELLAALFHDGAVMAVGDPHQSIYGWRGASADNLAAFPSAFARQTGCAHYGLTVSWRNDEAILTAANGLLRAAAGRRPGEALRPRPGAKAGRVDHVFAGSVEEEADAVAEWFARVRAEHDAGEARTAAEEREHGRAYAPRPPSGAVLFRTKRHMQTFADALGARGIPHRILGLGGLLSAPEVVDVVAALRAVHDPTQGSALLRLLAGPRFALGVADLAALHAVAETLARRDAALGRLPEELAQRLRGSAGTDEQASIVDAVDFVRSAPDDHWLLAGLTPAGRGRTREAGAMLERLRRAVGQPIPDLIRLIEQELRLDIELAANEARGPARLASSRLRTFVDEVRAFLLADDRGSLGALLAWLDHAEDTDELMPRPEPPEPGTVQLLTIHGAKGLEWDAVSVVRLVDEELPKAPRTKQGWLGFGALPYALRGDRDALPHLAWDPEDDDDSFIAAVTAFHDAERSRQEAEERRLAYVAVTRARADLLLSGSHWAGQSRSRRPSPYLTEMLDALGVETTFDEPGDNPYLEDGGREVRWPLDALAGRRDAVERAAQAVRGHADTDAGPDAVLAALLVEHERRRRGTPDDPPARIPASRFKDYVRDFRGTVRSVRRPLPEQPFPQAIRGTRFHEWVERRSGLIGAAVSPDDALWERDDEIVEPDVTPEGLELERLKAAFERSEWGALAPIAVETEIDVVLDDPALAGHVMICKLDAVYRREDRGGRIEIVDWKTGRPPTTAAERRDRLWQLALYRVAYHKAHGVPLDEIDVALYYVAHDLVVRSDEVLTEKELAAAWVAAGGNG